MPLIKYVNKRFNHSSRVLIDLANTIIADYQSQGFDLTLRQLYYQLVSRAVIKNDDKEYKRLGSVINDARLAGLVDWNAIVDRTRNLRDLGHWNTPADIIKSASYSFAVDKWANQAFRPEVWIEKDALTGVIAGVCNELDVPFFSCRGYTSQSEMWSAGQRLQGHLRTRHNPLILHLGDHDPSGMDMSRDITERLKMFMGGTKFERLALNMDQIEQYNPPPNPAKLTDSRCTAYIAEFGDSSWELDALDPKAIAKLIRDAVMNVRHEPSWAASVEVEQAGIRKLQAVSEQWSQIEARL